MDNPRTSVWVSPQQLAQISREVANLLEQGVTGWRGLQGLHNECAVAQARGSADAQLQALGGNEGDVILNLDPQEMSALAELTEFSHLPSLTKAAVKKEGAQSWRVK